MITFIRYFYHLYTNINQRPPWAFKTFVLIIERLIKYLKTFLMKLDTKHFCHRFCLYSLFKRQFLHFLNVVQKAHGGLFNLLKIILKAHGGPLSIYKGFFIWYNSRNITHLIKHFKGENI